MYFEYNQYFIVYYHYIKYIISNLTELVINKFCCRLTISKMSLSLNIIKNKKVNVVGSRVIVIVPDFSTDLNL